MAGSARRDDGPALRRHGPFCCAEGKAGDEGDREGRSFSRVSYSLAWGLAIAAATLALMIATEPRLAIVWDEGYSLGRQARVRWWFQAVRDPRGFSASWRPPAVELVQSDGRPPPPAEALDTRAELFGGDVLAWFWPFAREEPHGHPPFYALVGLIGDVLAPGWEVLPRARLGTMLAFSLTAGAIYAVFARRWATWPALLAVGAWVLPPRLFAHGHYCLYDALLTSLWVGSILAFSRAVEPRGGRFPRWPWVVVFGLLAGWAAETKLTGWFLPIPFLAWTALDRNRRGAWTLAIGGVIALAILYAFNPPWWDEPIRGVERFLRSNLSRGQTTRIPTLFLGRVIVTPQHSLPWYNTLVWTVFVTPVGFLALAGAGAVRAVRRFRDDPFGLLAVGHWAFLLVLRALPHTPGHDGERQFLPAFGCLALVAGLGAAWAVERFGRWGKVLIAACLAEGVVSLALMMPVPLSYYSPLVGGLPGATALGMEPTYYWDALSDEALAWLNDHTGPGKKVLFASNPSTWFYLRQTGRLRAATTPPEPGRWAYYVIQNRAASLRPLDRCLIDRGRPSFVVSKWGVPLIWIFPFDEVEACLAEVAQD
jgi:4-amino-4-deoxy-L-arabinose transferase-like glycosyltransferase